jgi:hypothetical protein
LLKIPINFYQTLQEGAKDISLTGSDPMWTLLNERSKNPAVLYASSGRIAKATSHFASYLCEVHSYRAIDKMMKRYGIFSNNKTRRVFSGTSRFFS